jgi:hypothetical protein
MTIFRGEREKIHELLDTPMYFSTYKNALMYSTFQCEAVRAVRDLCLFEFSRNNVRRLHSQLNPEEQRVLRIYFGVGMAPSDYNIQGVMCGAPTRKRRAKPMICTQGFLSQEDSDNHVYISKKLALILCALGFDGWYVPNLYTRTDGTAFHEEIVVCNPAANLKIMGPCEAFASDADSLFCV